MGVEDGTDRTTVEPEPILDIRRRVGIGLMVKPLDNRSEPFDYIACDLPDDMTLAQFRQGLCQHQKRAPRIRDLGIRWLRRAPRD
jgi:hypothetical protein